MFCAIAGCSVVSQWFIGMIRCPVVRYILWDSKMFCFQSVVHSYDKMFSGQEVLPATIQLLISCSFLAFYESIHLSSSWLLFSLIICPCLH